MTVSVRTICRQYLGVFPQEREALSPLIGQLERKGEADITSSKTFDVGHVTAGALVVSLPSRRVLLIEHKAHEKLLQPGGHIEPEDESFVAAARRECEEEVGLSQSSLNYIPLSEQNKDLPFNIAVYDIRRAALTGEPEHKHYDLLYLFTVEDGATVTAGEEEAVRYHWIPLIDFAGHPEFGRQAEKVEKLLTTA